MVVLGFETNVAIIQSSMSIIVCFQKLPVRRTPDSFLTNVSAYICKITSCTRSDLFGPNGISELWRLGFKRGGQVPCCRAGCGPDPELDMPTVLGELEFCSSAQMGPSRVKSMFMSMFSRTPRRKRLYGLRGNAGVEGNMAERNGEVASHKTSESVLL